MSLSIQVLKKLLESNDRKTLHRLHSIKFVKFVEVNFSRIKTHRWKFSQLTRANARDFSLITTREIYFPYTLNYDYTKQ